MNIYSFVTESLGRLREFCSTVSEDGELINVERNQKLLRNMGLHKILRRASEIEYARRDSAEHFSRLNALYFTAEHWIFISAYCFAIS